MRLLEEDNTFIQFQTIEPLTQTKTICSACKKECEKLYQHDMCKECLSLTFKRLIKVIDSVRK